MPAFGKEISRLKDRLMSEKNFGKILTYFFDHLGENKEFMDLGRRTQDDLLIQVLAQIGVMLDASVLSHDLLTEIPESHFIHGTCMFDQRLATVLYFTDIDMGLCAVLGNSGVTQFTRFRCERLNMAPPESATKPNLN